MLNFKSNSLKAISLSLIFSSASFLPHDTFAAPGSDEDIDPISKGAKRKAISSYSPRKEKNKRVDETPVEKEKEKEAAVASYKSEEEHDSLRETQAVSGIKRATELLRPGLNHWRRSEWDKAKDYFLQALNLTENGNFVVTRMQRTGLLIKLAQCCTRLDFANSGASDGETIDYFQQALDYYHQALDLTENGKIVLSGMERANILRKIASLYSDINGMAESTNKAIDYFQQALDLREDDTFVISGMERALLLERLSDLYVEKKDSDNALFYKQNALEIISKEDQEITSQYPNEILDLLQEIMKTSFEKGALDEVIACYKQAFKMEESGRVPLRYLEKNHLLAYAADAYEEKGEWDKALSSRIKSILLVRQYLERTTTGQDISSTFQTWRGITSSLQKCRDLCSDLCSNISRYIILPELDKLDTWRPFKLSEEVISSINRYTYMLGSLEGRFSPHNHFKDGIPHALLHKLTKQASEELILYNNLVKFFNAPGFFLADVKLQAPLKQSAHVLSINIGQNSYLCVGKENVKAGLQLQQLLVRGQDSTRFKLLISWLQDISDQSDEETVKAIKDLENIPSFFEELAHTFMQEIVIGASSRNQLFRERVWGKREGRK